MEKGTSRAVYSTYNVKSRILVYLMQGRALKIRKGFWDSGFGIPDLGFRIWDL